MGDDMTAASPLPGKRRALRRASDVRLLGVQRELEAARRISEALFDSEHPDEVVERSLEIATEVVDAAGGSILIADQESRQLVFRHSVGVRPVEVGTSIPWDKGIAGAVFNSGVSVIVHDVQGDNRHFKKIDTITNLLTTDMIASPLKRWQGGTIGVLEVVNKRGGPFDDQDLSLIAIVSAITAAAIERARLNEEAKLAVAAHLVAGISHDIKNLLTPIVYGAAVIAESLETLVGCTPPGQRAAAEKAARRCRTAVDTVAASTLLTQERLKEITDCILGQSVAPRFAPCSVASVVGRVFETLGALAQRRGVALIAAGLERLPEVTADEGKLFNAFYNLINNALAEVPPGGSVTIDGAGTAAGDGLSIRVTDTGRGMTPEVRDRLFTDGVTSRKHLGNGLGTKLVKDVIDAHAGRITVESAPGAGTTFTILLPLAREGA